MYFYPIWNYGNIINKNAYIKFVLQLMLITLWPVCKLFYHAILTEKDSPEKTFLLVATESIFRCAPKIFKRSVTWHFYKKSSYWKHSDSLQKATDLTVDSVFKEEEKKHCLQILNGPPNYWQVQTKVKSNIYNIAVEQKKRMQF